MKTDHQQQTAKIYIFPLNRVSKAGSKARFDEFDKRAYENHVDVDSWYHQDAIDDSSTSTRKQ